MTWMRRDLRWWYIVSFNLFFFFNCRLFQLLGFSLIRPVTSPKVLKCYFKEINKERDRVSAGPMPSSGPTAVIGGGSFGLQIVMRLMWWWGGKREDGRGRQGAERRRGSHSDPCWDSLSPAGRHCRAPLLIAVLKCHANSALLTWHGAPVPSVKKRPFRRGEQPLTGAPGRRGRRKRES